MTPDESVKSTEPSAFRSAPKGRALAVLGGGAVLAVAVFGVQRERERTAWQHELEKKAGDVVAALVNGLDMPLEALHSVPALFNASDDVSRREFSQFVEPLLARHAAIYALEWLPEVPAGERDKWERRGREEGVADFRFTEVGPGLELVPAKPRPRHVPIFYMVPSEPKALGFDIASDSRRLEPFELAKRTRRAVASGRIRLVEDAPGVHSIAVFEPVERAGKLEREFVGCAVEVFRIKPVVERALRGHDFSDLGLDLYDQDSVPQSDRLLYERPAPAGGAMASVSRWFPFADRTWTVRVGAVEPSRAGALPVALGVFAAGLLLALMVQALATVRVLRRRVRDAERLGQYTLVAKLGEGGMGVVYEASHAMLRRPTALKLLRATRSDPRLNARFEREVQLTSQLAHPNTIAVYDYGRTPAGVLYYAMEFIEGIDFEELVRSEGPLPAGRVVHLLRQVLASLAEAHRLGLVHRDVKPANLMACQRGGLSDFVKVLDFGLAKQLHDAPPLDASLAETIVGTPHYLAPEAISGQAEIGPKADLYGVGAVAYYLLTGHTVFEGETLVAICLHHLSDAPARPSSRVDRPIPEGLERLVLSCLEKEPDARPESAEVLAAELDALSDVPVWPPAHAAAWWDERGRALIALARERRERRSAAPGGNTTVLVDLGRRETLPTTDPNGPRQSPEALDAD